MKKLLIMLVSFGLAYGASAQVHRGRGIKPSGPRITYVVPRVSTFGLYSPFYPSYGLGYGMGYGYNPFFGPSMYRPARPSKLDLQIEDIRNDYKDRIWSARRATDLSKKERRAKVQELKHEREAAIIDAKRNYYKSGTNS